MATPYNQEQLERVNAIALQAPDFRSFASAVQAEGLGRRFSVMRGIRNEALDTQLRRELQAQDVPRNVIADQLDTRRNRRVRSIKSTAAPAEGTTLKGRAREAVSAFTYSGYVDLETGKGITQVIGGRSKERTRIYFNFSDNKRLTRTQMRRRALDVLGAAGKAYDVRLPKDVIISSVEAN